MTGADISASALETTGNRLAEVGQTAELHRLDSARLPYEDASYDVVIAWQVLTYNDWDSLPLALTELDRVLRPGGIFIATLSAPGDYMQLQGKPLGDGMYELQDRGQAGALINIVDQERIPGLFAGKDIKTGWFGFEFDGTPSRHWVVSYAK